MRKPIAMLILLIYLGAYIWAVSLIAGWVVGRHALVQLGFYLMAGFLWVAPLKPLFAWMNAKTPPPE